MRVLWLCKGRYMNHDVINDRYARLFELPECLGGLVEVRGFCLDYRLNRTAGIPGDLSERWGRASIPRTLFLGWIVQLLLFVRQLRPQCVVASSDCLQIILGALLAKLYGASFVADLYDDYTTFGLAHVPGLRWLYRRALSGSDGIIAVSETLGDEMRRVYPDKPILVLESTIDNELFFPRDKQESRNLLGIQVKGGQKLVGVCGGLNADHGIETVFSTIRQMERDDPSITFVIAGRQFSEQPLPKSANVNYLGTLPYPQMPVFYSAMDLVIIPLANTRFGHFAFPQKAYETLACGVLAAAADVGAMSRMFKGHQEALYAPDSPASLARAVRSQLATDRGLTVEIPTWSDQAQRLLRFIGKIRGNVA